MAQWADDGLGSEMTVKLKLDCVYDVLEVDPRGLKV